MRFATETAGLHYPCAPEAARALTEEGQEDLTFLCQDQRVVQTRSEHGDDTVREEGDL